MKRCPQCLFLYPDSDERCDFDKTQLESVSDAEIDAATSKAKKRRVLPIVAAVALILTVLAFAIYYAVSRQKRNTTATTQTPTTVAAPKQPLVVIGSSPSPDVSPSPSPSPSVKSSPTVVASSHTRASTDPVSTSGPGIGKKQGGKPVIMLTTGGKIDADEVWRTRDGVWYRRNGMVTLLKSNHVKAIVTR